MTMSMRALFGWVAFAAVAAAALTQASVLWTGLVFTAAVLFTGWAILAAILLRDSRRTFWIGAAVCSLGYFFLISGGLSAFSGQPAVAGRLLVTHQLLAHFAPQDSGTGIGYSPYGVGDSMWSHQLLVGDEMTIYAPTTTIIPAANIAPTLTPVPYVPSASPANVTPSYKPAIDGAEEAARPEEEEGATGTPPSAPSQLPNPGNQPMSATSPAAWARTTWTAAPRTTFTVGRGARFLVAGHCLFAILFGLAGGWSARRFLGSAGVQNSVLST